MSLEPNSGESVPGVWDLRLELAKAETTDEIHDVEEQIQETMDYHEGYRHALSEANVSRSVDVDAERQQRLDAEERLLHLKIEAQVRTCTMIMEDAVHLVREYDLDEAREIYYESNDLQQQLLDVHPSPERTMSESWREAPALPTRSLSESDDRDEDAEPVVSKTGLYHTNDGYYGR